MVKPLTESLSRAEWFEVLADAAEGQSLRPGDEQLPRFPSPEIQIRTTGQAGRATLSEAFAFYEATCLAFERVVGRALDRRDKVLDFGTGWGRILRFFVREVGSSNCYGTDVDEELVALCRGLFGFDNFTKNMPFPPTVFDDNSFSLITGFSVFSHLSEAACRAWMKEFYRILRPDGLAALTTRGRWFFDYCEGLGQQVDDGGYAGALGRLFSDFGSATASYDAGEIVHVSSPGVSGGKALAGGFYGETFIPKRWASEEFLPLMRLVDFLEVPGRHPIMLLVPVVDAG